MKIPSLSTNYIHRSLGRSALFSVLLMLACFALSPPARAVCQEGCDGDNTFLGDDALVNNAGGYANTAIGADALRANTVGHSNTAVGNSALSSSTNTREDTATGDHALAFNTTGNYNTAIGYEALFSNITGDNNTAIGDNALYRNTGPGNVALGVSAGVLLTTGSGNVCVGASVHGVAGESNTTRIKNVYSSVASDRAVYVTADNKIGTLVSSRRFKDEIKPIDKASEAILALKPVTFRYKKEIESNGSIMFGLIAEDVEKADPDLVTRNEKGEAETVRYDAVNAMLLNEFLKEHRTVQELKSIVAKQEATAAHQQKQIEALTARLQKVSEELELSKPAPQTVGNDQ
jgi:Chaperone of endosialidase